MENENRIKELREAGGLTQEALGDRIGLSQRAISLYERGDLPLPAHVIAALCRVFGVSPRELFVSRGVASAVA